MKQKVFSLLLGAFLVVGMAVTQPCTAGEDGSPYGGFRGGPYGQKRSVDTAEDARRLLRDYFGKRDVRIGDMRERENFFEADVLDRSGVVVDKVIVNKRTGRIRSIY